MAHPDYLEEALRRIIDNAVQFTPPGGSIVVHSHDGSGYAVIEVTDTGVGVSPADLSQIFEPFFRGDRARSSDTGKPGLGLSIVKRIVELHYGTIELESAPDQGTTVRIRLPANAKRSGRQPEREAELIPVATTFGDSK